MFRRLALFWGLTTLAALSIVGAVPRNTVGEIVNEKPTQRVQRLADEEVSNDKGPESLSHNLLVDKKSIDQDDRLPNQFQYRLG